jgi:asparagine synthase (glutamine-hydrolysing)
LTAHTVATDSPTWAAGPNPGGLSALEVAAGVVLGQAPGTVFGPDPGADPISVLREQARLLLATPPCVVAFSGGRDSSALLATLADVARRDGLAPPIAVTARWDDDPASDERAWQEEVIATIGVRDWEIIRPGTDLDLLGEEAQDALGRLGLMWPAPAYALRPLMRRAAGGTFVSGEGGDEAFGLWPYGRLWDAVRHAQRPRRSDVRALALGCAPRPVRRWRMRHTRPPYQTWLRPEAFARLALAQSEEQIDDPLRFDRYQVVSRRRRSTDLSLRTLEDLCALEGAQYVGPFLSERFLSALAGWGGALGRGDRTAVMSTLFVDVLPGPVLARTSKASFGAVFWGPASRRFAKEWDGAGVAEALVDSDALRDAWLASLPVYGAALPLQAAWLSAQRHAPLQGLVVHP